VIDNHFEKLLNPSWLKFVEKLNNPTGLHAFAQHETGVMKLVREMEKANQLSSLAFNNSKIMTSIERLTNQNNFVRSILRQSESMSKLQRIVNSSPLTEIYRQQSGTEQLLSKLNQLSSFKALTQLQNSPFSGELPFDSTIGVNTVPQIDASLLEIDSQISEEISAATDFNDLSETTKKILLHVYYVYFLPIFFICLSPYIIESVDNVRKGLQSISTASEVRSFSRSPNKNFDRSLLTGFRITTARSLRFRDGSSMKANVLTELPIGTLVEVIDKSNRSWLLVEVEIDGSFEQGWVARRHTVFFK